MTYPARDDSPSRGKMTITLHSSSPGENDETAKVKIEVNNPELVAERVVSQLARKFPPESVVTIAAGPYAGNTTTTDDDEIESRTEDVTSSTDDLGQPHRQRHGGSVLSSTSSSQRKAHRLLVEHPPFEKSGERGGSLQGQHYLVTKKLDTAIPIREKQDKVRLADRSSMSVDPRDVFTVYYDESGHAVGTHRAYESESRLQSVPANIGVASFKQDYLLSEELERAVPICPGQEQIHLVDDSTFDVDSKDVCSVFYGEKGMAAFHRLADGSVYPGTPTKPGVAHTAVPHRVSGNSACPMSTSEVPSDKLSRKNVHVVLYDNVGRPICVRGPSGSLSPDGLSQRGSAAMLEYYYTPKQRTTSIPAKIASLSPHNRSVQLTTGESISHVNPVTEISSFLRASDGSSIGAYIPGRRPSFHFGSFSELLQHSAATPRAGLASSPLPPVTTPVHSSKVPLHSSSKHRLRRHVSDDDDTRSTHSSFMSDISSPSEIRASRPAARQGRAARRHYETVPLAQSTGKETGRYRPVGPESTVPQSVRQKDRHKQLDLDVAPHRTSDEGKRREELRREELRREELRREELRREELRRDIAAKKMRKRRSDIPRSNVEPGTHSRRLAAVISEDEGKEEDDDDPAYEDDDDYDEVADLKQSSSRLRDPSRGATRAEVGSRGVKRREPATWMGNSTDSQTDSFTGSGAQSSFAAGQKLLKRSSDAETYSCSQSYFLPVEIDYAIPVLQDQVHVKLANGEKIKIQPRNVITVDYDRRGLPIRTTYADGRETSWIIARPGIGAKVQDYFVHSDLVSAVPIAPDQEEVTINDGTTISIPPSHVTSVFYDANGKPAFSLAKHKRKLKPGLNGKAGVAASIQYLQLLDCADGSGEQFVIPFKASANEIPNPRKPGRFIPVNRKAITIAFFDKDKNPLYSQLPDGRLVGGGLVGSRFSTEDGSLGAWTSDHGSDHPSSHLNLRFPYSSSIGRIPVHQQPSIHAPAEESGQRSKTTGRPSRVAAAAGAGGGGTTTSECVKPRRQEVIERRVPVEQVEYIEKFVEVPEVHYVDKQVEVEKIEWQTKIVKKKEIVERPVEHVKYVPKIETHIVERIIEIPEIIEVPRPEIIERKVKVDRFVDTKKNVTVSQSIKPLIRDTLDIFEEVECLTLEPDLIPVDVFVPRLVKSKLVAVGVAREDHREVEIPLAHYNSLILKMNPLFANNYEKLPMIKTSSGCFPLLPADQQVTVISPTAEEITRVLKAAGIVSRTATTTEVNRIAAANHDHILGPGDQAAIIDDFAPRTSVIPSL